MTDARNAQLQALARNNRWSNHRLLGAVAALGRQAFAAPRPGFFPSLRATLNHLHAVDLYYIDALEGGGRGRAAFRDASDHDDPAALAADQAAADARLIAVCDGLPDGGADRVIVTDRGDAGRFEERCGDLLLHLFLHQTHHRGQAHAMLSHAGAAPPQLDEFFLAFDRADDIDAALAAAATGER